MKTPDVLTTHSEPRPRRNTGASMDSESNDLVIQIHKLRTYYLQSDTDDGDPDSAVDAAEEESGSDGPCHALVLDTRTITERRPIRMAQTPSNDDEAIHIEVQPQHEAKAATAKGKSRDSEIWQIMEHTVNDEGNHYARCRLCMKEKRNSGHLPQDLARATDANPEWTKADYILKLGRAKTSSSAWGHFSSFHFNDYVKTDRYKKERAKRTLTEGSQPSVSSLLKGTVAGANVN